MEDFECGGLIFNSKFDSGNLGRVELVQKNNEVKPENYLLKEFKLWTKPDCSGTCYENGNRTWFFFGVRGGEIYQTIKFSLMNLNKQAKLYSQGMSPVVRVENGKWERIKDKPTYYIENENFVLSFNHRILTPDVTVYYAFTYPYTYGELQDNLQKLDKKFFKNTCDINFFINKSIQENKIKEDDLTKINLEITTKKNDGIKMAANDDEINYNDNTELKNNDFSPCIKEDNKNNMTNSEIVIQETIQNQLIDIYNTNDIYYHRELLIKSVEGRRVDLLTISSFLGIQEEREERLSNLFPDIDCLRCHTFKNKKIIFLSSRVHPGETPSSFVLNGLLNFLLDKKSIIAATLRKMYVFKIIPFLNPDGVYNGYYRSDTFGVNLNRVYLNPKLDTQPQIYASRKLIRFYHYGYDKMETTTNQCITAATTFNEIVQKNILASSKLQDLKENVDNFTPINFDTNYQEQISFKEINSSSGCDDSKSYNDKNTSTIFTDELIPEIKTTIAMKKEINNDCKIQQIVKTNDKLTAFKSDKFNQNLPETTRVKSASCTGINSKIPVKKSVLPKKDSIKGRNNSPILNGPYRKGGKGKTNLYNNDGVDGEGGQIDDSSNIFLYIDFHGHASKKGVFMYGNYLPNKLEAVECMLLPRLISMNSHHFSFDACNFSERNMYLKGKKDGLSKEGSGRVSVYKAIGLIKSYTLESNYNTGKCVNVLPPKGKDTNVKIVNSTPPKFTPAIFEEVGRAIGPSILDLTNSNPLSRLNNSEFRTLQGLRNSLKIEVDKSIARSNLTSKVNRPKLRRMKSNYSSTNSTQIDVLKENKTLYDMPWDLTTTGTNLVNITTQISSSSTTPATITTTATKTLITKNLNKKLQNKNQTIFGKKENTIKKLKVLCDATSSSSSPSLLLSPSTSALTSSSSSKIINIKGNELQIQQVPRKRIKVSSATSLIQQSSIDPVLITSMAKLDTTNYDDFTRLNKMYMDAAAPTTTQSSSSTYCNTTSSSSSFYSSTPQTDFTFNMDTKKILNNLIVDVNNDFNTQNLPCCSTTLKYCQINTIPNNTTTTTSSSITVPQSIISLQRTNKNKFNKTSAASNLVKKLGDVSKLKKKRILKTETNLKRKKSRVKTQIL